MSSFNKHRFHTHLLIPNEIVTEFEEKEAQLENIKIWQEARRSSHYFKQGDEVVHVSNLKQVMYVDRVVKKDNEGKSQSKGPKIIAIDCHWFTAEDME